MCYCSPSLPKTMLKIRRNCRYSSFQHCMRGGGEVIGRWSSICIWHFCFWYSPAKTGEYSPIFKTACIAKKIWRIINTIVSIWDENMLAYLSPNIIWSSKLTVFLELRSRKTVHFSEQIMSADKYPGIFSCQMEAIVYMVPIWGKYLDG